MEEVKGVNLESLSKREERDLFLEYAEDHNTGTLPGEKFYDLDAWTKAEAIRRRAEGDAATGEERTTFDDEAERRREIEETRAARAAEYKREAYERMKDSGDLENLRAQERLKQQRRAAYNTGDTETVERINKILAPDDK